LKREEDRLKGVGGIPTQPVRVVKVRYSDFMKYLPEHIIKKWQYEQAAKGTRA